MQEKRRLRRARAATGAGSPLDVDSGGAADPVTVTHGVYRSELPVAGMSVHEIRTRFGDRLDIHPDATATVGGRPVSDDLFVESGQTLSFIRPSGEKGAAGGATPGPPVSDVRKTTASSTASGPAPAETVVTIEGSEVCARTPEGSTARIPLCQLLHRVAPVLPQTGDDVLPDGVKSVLQIPPCGIAVVHQTAPGVHLLRWIAESSRADYGPGTRYRTVRVALPYVIVVAVFETLRDGLPVLGSRSECFFSNQPLDAEGLDTELFYPALLNCSHFPDDERHPLSWICIQNLELGAHAGGGPIRVGLTALLHHLFESGFNRSSENHELSSWFSETVKARVDPRLASVEAWEEATLADPLFALEVPWLPTGRTLRQIVERIGRGGPRRAARPTTAGELARLVFQMHHRARRARRARRNA